MFRIITLFLFIFCVTTGKSTAEVVNDIKILNNERISKETVLVFSNIEVGKDYSENDLNLILNDLYTTDFFKNVSLEIKNNTLFITVEENKVIQEVIIEGLKKQEMIKVLKKNIVHKDKNPFVENKSNRDISIIKSILKNSGYYFSTVDLKISENNNDTINLIYEINLGDKAYIESISFIGDKFYKDRTLRAVIASEENKFWKFITSKKFVNPDLISLDTRLLKNFYLNKGFYAVQINESLVELTGENNFKLTYSIDAGPKYKIKSAKLILPDDYDEKDFTEINKKLDKFVGEYYSLNKLNKVTKLVDRLSFRNDYEFINAAFNEKINSDNTLDLVFEIKEFQKQYLTRVNVLGNNVTEEKVIRDNLEVDEGDPFNSLLLAKSINNLKSLNIFGSVEYSLVDQTNDEKILNIVVEEKPTGEISAGAGTGTSGGTLAFGIRENNFLGKNIGLNTSLRLTEETLKGEFSVTNPNWNYSNRSLTTSLESSTTDRMGDYGYETSTTGFSFGSVWEQYDDIYFKPVFSTYYEKLDTNQTASANLKKQEGEYVDSIFRYTLDLDKRNQRFQTSDGFRSRFTQSIPMISEDYAFLNSYEYTTFNQIGDSNMITRFSFLGRTINSLTDEDVRISKRLYVPSKKLRGFQSGKIGPVDGGDYIGGNHTAVINASTTLPKFGADLQNVDFQLFVDAANVWGVDYDSSLDNSTLRSSTGISVDWFTVIGPLNFSFAQPISKASSDKTETFRFNIGTTF